MHQNIPRLSNSMKIRLVLTPICAAIMQAHAAEPAPPTAPVAQSEMLTVVVTESRKIRENQQSVPLAITSYTGEELAKQGVSDFNDIARETPNVLIRANGSGATAAVIAIRGQVANDIVVTLDTPVGVYIDGVVVSRPSGLKAAMVDVQSVETLKGPQGTLFGRNTTGGAILVKTNDPDVKEFDGKVSAEVGSYNLRHASAVLNVPLKEGVAALRFVVDKSDRDGYVTDKAGNKWDDDHSKMVRAKLLVKPTSSSSIVASGEYIYSESSVIAQAYSVGKEPIFTGLIVPPLNPLNFARQKNFSLVATNEFDWGVLKLTAGLRKLDTVSNVDIAALGFLMVNGDLKKPDGLEKTLELQASGRAFNDRLAWTAGAFAFKETAYERDTTNFNQAIFGLAKSIVGGDIVGKSHAFYVQGSYRVFEATKLTVGVRNSKDEKSLLGSYLSIGTSPAFSILSPATGGSKSYSNTNYAVTLDHSVGKDQLVYVSRSTGYRAGGFSLNPTFSSFDPEHVVNSEIGLKSEWLGHKLRINAALYRQDYQNFQVTLVVGNPPLRVVQNANGKISGGELEISAVPATGVRTGLTYGQTDAKYTSTALAGQAFSQIPKTTSSLFGSYRTNLSFGAWESRIDYSRTASINFATGSTTGEAKVPAYDLINLRTSLELAKWDLALYVKNAADKKYFVSALSAVGTVGWNGAPRTVGMTASYTF